MFTMVIRDFLYKSIQLKEVWSAGVNKQRVGVDKQLDCGDGER